MARKAMLSCCRGSHQTGTQGTPPPHSVCGGGTQVTWPRPPTYHKHQSPRASAASHPTDCTQPSRAVPGRTWQGYSCQHGSNTSAGSQDPANCNSDCAARPTTPPTRPTRLLCCRELQHKLCTLRKLCVAAASNKTQKPHQPLPAYPALAASFHRAARGVSSVIHTLRPRPLPAPLVFRTLLSASAAVPALLFAPRRPHRGGCSCSHLAVRGCAARKHARQKLTRSSRRRTR
jgi:hypothetical protein